MIKNQDPISIKENAGIDRLSLQFKEIDNDTLTIRSLDWDRDRFDIEFGLRNGTTYNSYLIRGEQTALVDGSHIKFKDIWFTELEKFCKLNTIDYLIVNHTEPDHSGLIGPLLEINPNIKIFASKIAIQFLESQIHQSFNAVPVKNGDKLEIGINPRSGVNHNFEFILAPNLHWPDTIFTYDHGTKILYTCDGFGLHYCSDDVFDSDPKIISPDFRFYYECLMAPNARSLTQALKKIDKLPKISAIAVGHGPILRDNLNLWLDNYREWSSQNNKNESYAAVCYLSSYAFCDRLSQAIAQGIGKTNTKVQLIDLQTSEPQELSALISDANAVIVPTWNIKPNPELQKSISTLLAALKTKQWVGVYEAFGGNDQPIDVVISQIRSQGQKEAFSPLRVLDSPDNNTYQRFEEAGTDLGQILNRKKNIASTKSIDSDLNKALGKISGGLYIVTAEQGEEKNKRSGAMVASWVSQASFNPPGLTVAVAKDRAIEALMKVGDRFVLNVLQEDNYLHLFRHFLKRFAPGVDRFADIEVIKDAANGGPVLSDALAFLSCIVKQRLETPDHWIIYGIVENGKVANPDAKTAVHHRKVGSNY